MMRSRILVNLGKYFWFWASTFIIFFLTFPHVGTALMINIDSSYIYALNYAFVHNLRFGTEIIFTYGPLGFLLFPQPLGDNLILGILAHSALKIIFIAGLLLLTEKVRKPRTIGERLFISLLVLLFSNVINFGLLLVFTTAVTLLLHKHTRQWYFLWLGLFIASVSVLVNIAYAASTVLMLLGFGLQQSLSEKKNKSFHLWPSIVFGLPGLFLLLWVLLYGDFIGVTGYLRGTVEFAKGISTSMSLNTANNWYLLTVFIVLFMTIPFLIKQKNGYFLYYMSIFAAIASWKHTFTREDIEHLNYFFEYILLFCLLLFLYVPRVKLAAALLVFTALVVLGWNMQIVSGNWSRNFVSETVHKLLIPRGIKNFSETVFHYRTYENKLKEDSYVSTFGSIISPQFQKIIAEKTVDIYPWETSFIPANNLNWAPRPVFQSYTAYTPWLDEQNAKFLRSQRAPEFILWDRYHWGWETESIDSRYLLNDEPQTIYAIFNNYVFIGRDDRVALWQRRTKPLFQPPRQIRADKISWNTWIDVPSHEAGVLRTRIFFSNNLLGVLKRMVWREIPLSIAYRLQDGSELIYRLVSDNASSGVWVEPFLVLVSPLSDGLKVTHIRLINHNLADYRPDVSLGWVSYPFVRVSL